MSEAKEGVGVCSGRDDSEDNRSDNVTDRNVMRPRDTYRENVNIDLPDTQSKEGTRSGTEAEHLIGTDRNSKLIKVPLCEEEEISDSEADNAESPVGSAVTCTFSFALSGGGGDQESQRETGEVESRTTTGAHMSAASLPKLTLVAPHGSPDARKEDSDTQLSLRKKDLRETSKDRQDSDSSISSQKKLRKTGKDGRDSDSSVSSRKKSSSKKTQVKSKFAPGSLQYIEERLRGRIFSGWVDERRWVEDVGGYRDVIEVDEWEVEMIQQIKAIISSMPGVQEGTKWINITPPRTDPNYRLWVLLPAPPRPGHYWFSVTGVQVQPQFGLRIVVREIREIHPHDGETVEVRRKRQQRGEGGGSGELESLGDQVQEWMTQLGQMNLSSIWAGVSSTITIANIKEAIRFVVVLVMTVVLGLVTVLRESHHVGLRFMREGGIFLRNVTPFLQSVLGFFEKLVGGLYLLVAMVYRDMRRPRPPSYPPPQPPPPPYTPQSLTYPTTPGPSSVPYGPRQIKYVPPERWVYRSQDKEPPPT